MYVYTAILENEFVRDVKASLLRLVPIQFRNYTYLNFPKLPFLPINRRIAVLRLSKCR